MAASVNTDGSQTCTVGTEHTLATITAGGTYDLELDFTNAVGGTTPDIFEVREYIKVRAGGSEVLKKVYTVVGAQVEIAFNTWPRLIPHHVKYTLKQTQGTGRAVPWAVYQA